MAAMGAEGNESLGNDAYQRMRVQLAQVQKNQRRG